MKSNKKTVSKHTLPKRDQIISLVKKVNNFNDRWPLKLRIIIAYTETDKDIYIIPVTEFKLKDEVSFLTKKATIEDSLKKSDLKKIHSSKVRLFEKNLRSILGTIILI